MREIASGTSKRLTAAPPKEFAYFSTISRDAKSVAYAWFNSERFYEQRSIQLDGTGQKTLFKNAEAGFVRSTVRMDAGQQTRVDAALSERQRQRDCDCAH